MNALATTQFEINDLRAECNRLDKLVWEYDDDDKKNIGQISLWKSIAEEETKKVSELQEKIVSLEDSVKYMYHVDYVKDVDNLWYKLFHKIKTGFSDDQKKFLIDYLDYYKYDYIEKSMNQTKDLMALQYRNGSIGAIVSLKIAIQKTVKKKQVFDAVKWEFVTWDQIDDGTKKV
jgi:hypothetical protein